MEGLIECTILKASNNKIEILFFEDIQPILEKKSLWKREDIWIVESPLGNEILNTHEYHSDSQTATLNLKSQLKKGKWVRFRLIEDRKPDIFNPDKILAQASATAGRSAKSKQPPSRAVTSSAAPKQQPQSSGDQTQTPTREAAATSQSKEPPSQAVTPVAAPEPKQTLSLLQTINQELHIAHDEINKIPAEEEFATEQEEKDKKKERTDIIITSLNNILDSIPKDISDEDKEKIEKIKTEVFDTLGLVYGKQDAIATNAKRVKVQELKSQVLRHIDSAIVKAK